MIGYNDLYEFLRKEKYSETLQQLPKNFLTEISSYFNENKSQSSDSEGLFADSVAKNRKQYENAISLFKELITRRKKKILNLVFVATETGIMKRDYENMIDFEKETFDVLVKAFEEGDKKLNIALSGEVAKKEEKFRLILFKNDVEEFVDFGGKPIGPFSKGELSNIDAQVAEIIVKEGNAEYVEEN